MKPAPDAEDYADGSAEAKNASDEEWEAIARVGKHCGGGVMENQMARTIGEDDPREESKAESPDQTGTGGGGTAREENAED
jgi:hypothetical protein